MEINKDTLECLFIDSIEGGINYWACVSEYDYKSFTAVVCDNEDEDGVRHSVGLDTIKRGISKLQEINNRWANNRLANVLSENYDAEDCDVIFQLGLFGEVVYG